VRDQRGMASCQELLPFLYLFRLASNFYVDELRENSS